MSKKNLRVVNSNLVGEVWPAASPVEDPVLYGRAELSPEGAFQIRSFQTFTLKYTKESRKKNPIVVWIITYLLPHANSHYPKFNLCT